MTQAQQQALITENGQLKKYNIELHNDNAQLIQEQKEFQDALKKQVDRIKGYGPWKRFWASAQLFIDLITTIEKGFKS